VWQDCQGNRQEGTTGKSIIAAGIEKPSSDPAFLTVVGVHVLLGLACTITGIIAMLSAKRRGRHPSFGSIYYWCLMGVFVTASGLAAVRWIEDYQLFILGTLAFAAAYLGRMARRKRWSNWVKLPITGMGMSYVLLLTAFYVDNRKNLPLWRDLLPIAYLGDSRCSWDSPNCLRAVAASVGADAATAQLSEDNSQFSDRPRRITPLLRKKTPRNHSDKGMPKGARLTGMCRTFACSPRHAELVWSHRPCTREVRRDIVCGISTRIPELHGGNSS